MKTLARFPIGIIIGFWLGDMILSGSSVGYDPPAWAHASLGAITYWFLRDVLRRDPGECVK